MLANFCVTWKAFCWFLESSAMAETTSIICKALPRRRRGGAIWVELLTTSKLLSSTYVKIKGICYLKALKFKCLKYTGENTALEQALGGIPLGFGIVVENKPSVLRNLKSLCVHCTLRCCNDCLRDTQHRKWFQTHFI